MGEDGTTVCLSACRVEPSIQYIRIREGPSIYTHILTDIHPSICVHWLLMLMNGSTSDDSEEIWPLSGSRWSLSRPQHKCTPMESEHVVIFQERIH